ncbi:MAG: DUF2752 domain-containing protein [Gemmataceae bacterium]
MPPPTQYSGYREEPDPALVFWVRLLLVGILVGLSAVFIVAIYLNPYGTDGQAHRLATHQQLGLPPCTFIDVTGVPCPACGMTTSFALFVRGDLVNSMRANWVGTLLAGFCALVVPWSIGSLIHGRPLLVRSLEKVFLGVIITLLVLMSLRWGLVLLWGWRS